MRKRCELARVTIHAGSENSRKFGRAGPPQRGRRGGPAEQAIVEYVSTTLGPAHHVKVKGVSMSDSTQINRSISDGKIAGTIFQHKYWLGQVMAANTSFKEEPGTGPISHWIFGVWSDRYRRLADLPDGACISIPADPATEAQAQWLLEDAGLIRLKAGAQPWTAGFDDIAENPHRFSWLKLARRETLTVRQLLERVQTWHRLVTGSPEQLADTIETWFRAGAVDGFNLMPDVAPSGIEAFVDHVVPLLRRKGIFREGYEGVTLRAHLGLEVPR